jgi:hypothetical protein
MVFHRVFLTPEDLENIKEPLGRFLLSCSKDNSIYFGDVIEVMTLMEIDSPELW